MKWNKALDMIEVGLSQGCKVQINYHRKWMTRDAHWDIVWNVIDYEYEGKQYKAINTYHDQIDEGTHIVDSVELEIEW